MFYTIELILSRDFMKEMCEKMNQVITRIREKYEKMSPSQKVIAKYLLENEQEIPNLTARMLAENTFNVPSSIISFSKKIGYKGFNELKFHYSNEVQSSLEINSELINAFKLAEKVAKSSKFSNAVDLIKKAPRIFIIAFQMSQIPAKDFYFRMRKIEPSKMIFFESFTDQLRMAMMVEESDVVIVVSNTGESSEILRIQDLLSKKKCTQILVTNGINSKLAKYATIELSIGCIEDDIMLFSEAPTNARYALMYVLEQMYQEFLNENRDEKLERIKGIARARN